MSGNNDNNQHIPVVEPGSEPVSAVKADVAAPASASSSTPSSGADLAPVKVDPAMPKAAAKPAKASAEKLADKKKKDKERKKRKLAEIKEFYKAKGAAPPAKKTLAPAGGPKATTAPKSVVPKPKAPPATGGSPPVAPVPSPAPVKPPVKKDPVVKLEATETKRERPAKSVGQVQTWSRVAEDWTFFANAGSVVERRALKYGVHVQYSPVLTNETAPHAVSAGIREMLTVQAFAQFSLHKNATVCSVYGSPRDVRLFHSALVKVTEPTPCPSTIQVYRPMITAADLLRMTEYIRDKTVADLSLADGLLYVDVYETEDGLFDLSYVTKLLQGRFDRTLVWVGHRFEGDAGVVNEEGAWKRVDGKIRFRSDDTQAPYRDHDPCDWIWAQSTCRTQDGTIAWAQKTCIGDMVMVIFRHLPADIIPNVQPSAAQALGSVQLVQTPAFRYKSGVWGWLAKLLITSEYKPFIPARFWLWCPGIERRKVFVCRKVFDSLVHYVQGRSISELTMKQFISKTREEMAADSSSQLFYRLFPEEKPDPVPVALAVLTKHLAENELTFEMFNFSLGQTVAEYNNQLSKVGQETGRGFPVKRSLAAILGVLGLIAWMYWRKRRPISGNLIDLANITKNTILAGASSLVEGAKLRLSKYLGPLFESSNELLNQASGETKEGWDRLMRRELLDTSSVSSFFSSPMVTNLLSPFIEEFFKKSFPGASLINVAVEAYLLYCAVGWKGVFSYFPTAVMHIFTGLLPYWPAVGVHLAWNLMCMGFLTLLPGSLLTYVSEHKKKVVLGSTVGLAAASTFCWWANKPAGKSRWEVFRDTYYLQPWEVRPMVNCDKVRLTSYPRELCAVPTQQMRCAFPLQDEVHMQVVGSICSVTPAYRDLEKLPKTSAYWLIAHCVPGYVPARSDYNLAAVIKARITVVPPMHPGEQELAWYSAFFHCHTDLASDVLIDVWHSAYAAVPVWTLEEFYVMTRCYGMPSLDWPVDDVRLAVNWMFANHPWTAQLFRDQTYDPIPLPSEREIQEWAHRLAGPKKQRALTSCASIQFHSSSIVTNATKSVKIMVKTDEMLFKFDELEDADPHFLGLPQMKARSIANVNPLVAAYTGPTAFELQQRLKRAWHWNVLPVPVYIDGFQVDDCGHFNGPESAEEFAKGRQGRTNRIMDLKIVFTSGYTDYDLSCAVRQAQSEVREGVPYVMILVAGDDTLVLFWDRFGKFYAIESDLSMCDQSQSWGPLLMHLKVQRRMGANYEIAKLWRQLMNCTYVAVSRDKTSRQVVKKEERPILETGGVNTTNNNSMTCAWNQVSCMYSWIARTWSEDVSRKPDCEFLQDSSMRLGLKAKVKVHEDLADATFLKGAFYPVAGKHSRTNPDGFSHFWAPLPSRLLKVTKSLRPPAELYRDLKGIHADVQFLVDQAHALKHFASVPLLRAFVDKWASQGVRKKHFIEEWKVQASNRAPPLAAERVVMKRYGLEPSDMISFEANYPCRPYVFYEHPVFLALARVDYG